MRVRFVLLLTMAATLSASMMAAPQTAPAAAQQAADEEFKKGAFPADTKGLQVPAVTKHVQPKYTRDAMRAKIEGVVHVDVVVAADGSVDRVRVAKSLDTRFGLDEAALEAAKQWGFKPGTLNGKAVPVLVKLELEFRLQ